MKLVVFGLAISSSWGNGHATLWRGLCRALAARGHWVTFFEKDLPYYAAHRDMDKLEGGRLVFYSDWKSLESMAREEVKSADAAMITSYCPVAQQVAPMIREHARCGLFYDLDTPVTLSRLHAGQEVPYVPTDGLSGFDLVFSYTGGEALRMLQEELGAVRVAPLYGSVDPDVHRPRQSKDGYRSDLSYLGTYSDDRQLALEELFIEPARRKPDRRFVMGGAQYPDEFPWRPNIHFVRHLAPPEHAAFFCSSRLTLNVTRSPMRRLGFCPSGRLFEAAACGTPVISDAWEGLEQFFAAGDEILVATQTQDVICALELGDQEIHRMARNARERVLVEHTAARRAEELENALEGIGTPAVEA
jgi:spore maturation protein CgeB